MSTPVAQVRRTPIAAVLFGGILMVAAALVFLGIFLILPQQEHFGALLWIGSLSLLFAFGLYFAQALTTDPLLIRSVSWGFLVFGFATLFLTLSLAPNSGWNPLVRLVAIIVLLLLLGIVVAGIGWRARALEFEGRRLRARQDWSRRPPLSAFDYPAPGAPPAQAPPASNQPPEGT